MCDPPFSVPGYLWDPSTKRFFKGTDQGRRRVQRTNSPQPPPAPRTPSSVRQPAYHGVVSVSRIPGQLRAGRVAYSDIARYQKEVTAGQIGRGLKLVHSVSYSDWLSNVSSVRAFLAEHSSHGSSAKLPLGFFTDDGFLFLAGELALPPAELLTGALSARSSVISVSEAENVIRLAPSAVEPLYTLTDANALLVEATVYQRWQVRIRSTAASPEPCAAHYVDTSKRPEFDLRCMCAIDTGLGSGPLVALGIGKSVHIVQCGLGGEASVGSAVSWKCCRVGLSSDAMCVQLRQNTGSRATLFVGLRAGRILKFRLAPQHESMGVSRDSRELLNFFSQGAVTHLQMVNETECVAAYTNGDLILFDPNRFDESPIRQFHGHRNTFLPSLGLAIHAKHRLLACSGQDTRVRIWSLDDSSPLYDESGPACNPTPGQNSPLCASTFPRPPQALAWLDTCNLHMEQSAFSSNLPRLAVGESQTVHIFAA